MKRSPSWRAPGICQKDYDVDFLIRYKLNLFEKTWSAAKTFCSSKGEKLASIVQPGDALELLDEMKNQKGSGFFWIGATSEDGKVWKWADGSEIKEVKLVMRSPLERLPSASRLTRREAGTKTVAAA